MWHFCTTAPSPKRLGRRYRVPLRYVKLISPLIALSFRRPYRASTQSASADDEAPVSASLRRLSSLLHSMTDAAVADLCASSFLLGDGVWQASADDCGSSLALILPFDTPLLTLLHLSSSRPLVARSVLDSSSVRDRLSARVDLLESLLPGFLSYVWRPILSAHSGY